MKGNNTAAILLPVLLLASFFLDGNVTKAISGIRTDWLMAAVAIFDKFYFWIYIAFLAVTILAIIKGKKNKNPLGLIATIIMAMTVTYLLKPLLHRIRPDGLPFVGAFFGTIDYSFPSGHTTAAAAGAFAAPAALRIPWLIFTAATIFSRLYTNVHFLSDTVGAVVVSFAIAAFVKHNLKTALTAEDELEIRRQTAHFLIGIGIAAFVWKYPEYLNAILMIAVAGSVASYALVAMAKNNLAKKIMAALRLVERRKELQKFPGKGAITLFAGSWITAAIFRNEGVAAIAILAIGDSVSHLAGRLMGRTKYKWPFDRKKTIEGSLIGLISSAAAAAMIVPVWTAIAAAAAATAIEATNIKLAGRKLDDNLTVPLVAAAVMWALRMT